MKKKKEFNDLTKEQQIVAIAKDVLEQISIKKYLPSTGKYISNLRSKFGVEPFFVSEDVKSNFENIKDCEVCALGACLLSATKFKNELNFGDTKIKWVKPKAKKLFNSLFTPEQLLLIEHAFEGYVLGEHRLAPTYFDIGYQLSDSDALAVESFFMSYPDDTKRLIAIMKNIIKNKGVFKP